MRESYGQRGHGASHCKAMRLAGVDKTKSLESEA